MTAEQGLPYSRCSLRMYYKVKLGLLEKMQPNYVGNRRIRKAGNSLPTAIAMMYEKVSILVLQATNSILRQ